VARHYFVNDHGEIFRMTEARYGQYLLAGTREDKFPNAEEFGVNIGTALTVNNLTPDEFSDEYKAFDARRSWPAKTITNKQILAIVCPKCGADPGKACLSLQKRWENPMSRTVGIGDNGWRKTPHPERVRAAKAA
jgi:hypothetical protein